MEGKTYIGPFQSDYILQRCSSYRNEIEKGKSGSTNMTEKGQKTSSENRNSPRECIIKAHPVRAEELFEKVKKLSGIYVPAIVNGMLYFLPQEKQDLNIVSKSTDTSETTMSSHSSSSTSREETSSTSNLSDIKFHLAQIEKLVGRSEVLKAAVREAANDEMPVTPATSPDVGGERSTSAIIRGVNVSELHNALKRVKHLQEKEESECRISPAGSAVSSPVHTASSLHSVVSDDTVQTAIDAPEKWLQELKQELGLPQKQFVIVPTTNDSSTRKQTETNTNVEAKKDEKGYSPSRPQTLAPTGNFVSPSAESIISDRTLDELKKEMMSAESVQPQLQTRGTLGENHSGMESDEDGIHLRKAVRSPSFTDLRTAIEVGICSPLFLFFFCFLALTSDPSFCFCLLNGGISCYSSIAQ
ncbi:hypothetical protein Tcan_04041 [Toxocara canis]|uniref:Uncharacterized protein n=1 Tax=Toxocara canis TaxID=6265 RepID=A0A0B2W4Q5_TOXCA|nr:hypothetical protein Tcan_04041 [Toxocara canis]